jgi:hypothetical protein
MSETFWIYQLHYNMINRLTGKKHPQIVMNKLITDLKQKGISIEIIYSESVSIADCWIFIVEASTPWLADKLPPFITMQGINLDYLYPSDDDIVIQPLEE